MTLLTDWKTILSKAWSVKFMLAAALLSGAETFASVLGESLAKQLPPGMYAATVGVITALALVARILAQNEADEPEAKEAEAPQVVLKTNRDY